MSFKTLFNPSTVDKLFIEDYNLPGVVVFTKVTSARFYSNNGTALVAGDFALAGWGGLASVAVAAGSTDSRGRFTVTSAGAGQAANPTVVLTFADGAWDNAPFASAKLEASDDPSSGVVPAITTACTVNDVTFTFGGADGLSTPTAGYIYTIQYLIIG